MRKPRGIHERNNLRPLFLILAISVGVLGIIFAVALVVSIVILTGWITRLMLRRDSEPASESASE